MKKEAKKPAKSRYRFFEGLGDAEVNELFSRARIRTIAPGETLIREDDVVQTLLVLLEGRLQVFRKDGGSARQIDVLGEGSWVGALSARSTAPQPADIIARDACRVMELDRETLRLLGDTTREFILERLNELASARITLLAETGAALAHQNSKLAQSLYRERTRGGQACTDMAMIARVIAKVPRLPVFAGSLAAKLTDAGAGPDEVSELVQSDPSTVATILKTVNSARYAFRNKISDIRHAVVLLGYNEIYQLVISEGVRRIMPDTPGFQRIHARSVAVSTIAFILSQESQRGRPAQLATIGLLHNMGESVILLLKEKNPDLGVLLDFLDPAGIGALLLKSWNMPDVLWRTVEVQSFPEFCPPEQVPSELREIISITYIARLCADLFAGTREDDLPTAFFDNYRNALGWEAVSLEEIVRTHVLPVVRKKLARYPLSFRELIRGYLEAQAEAAAPPPGQDLPSLQAT